jgi:hypothetical protein
MFALDFHILVPEYIHRKGEGGREGEREREK